MDKLEPPASLSLTGNVAENWKRFKQRFELYLEASGATGKEDKQKACLLLHVIGEDALEIYNNFLFENDDDKFKLDVVIGKFEAYCSPKENVTYERHKFFTCSQKSDENIDQYVNDLRTKAKSCEFGELTDSLIKDRIVCGIPDNGLRARLLRVQDLKLNDAIVMCRAAETTKDRMKDLVDEQKDVHAVKHHKSTGKVTHSKQGGRTTHKQTPQKQTKGQCGRCGRNHGTQYQCPAMGKICNNCQRKNHFSKMCFLSKKVHALSEIKEPQTEHVNTTEFFVDTVNSSNSSNEEWRLSIKANGTDINFKLDTGSQVNIIPKTLYNKLPEKPKLHKASVRLISYSGDHIPVTGACVLKLNHKGQTTPVHFVVAEKEGTALIGVKACDKLNLVKRVFNIDKSSQSTEGIVQEFSDVFEGLGCLPGYHSIQVDPSVKPVVHPCRKVPFAIQERLKGELDRMEKMEVICKEDNPTPWVSSMVVVEKKNGQLRICLDPRDLNRAILREHYKLPTREEIMSKFKNAKYFSKLDASSGFWQMKLDSNSSKLTCFNTPFGRYRFLRLPFGISSAPEVYHKAIHMMFEHVEGASSIMDDIIVWGSTLEEHNQRLRKVLEATRESNLKLNREKCVCGVQSLTFIGDVVSAEGMKPDPLKVRAIKSFQTPESKKDVQRFLGMVNYQGRYIPDLSTKTSKLRQLLDEKNEFRWDDAEKKSFEELKDVLSSEPILRFYDNEREIKISADAYKSMRMIGSL